MNSGGRQTVLQHVALTRVSLGYLVRAKWMSATVITSVALVVVVLIGFLAMAAGFQQTLRNTGSPEIAVIMNKDATSEISSRMSREQVDLFSTAPAALRDSGGVWLSPELAVIVGGYRRDDHSRVNLSLRGLGPRGVNLRRGFRLLQGRMFQDGKNEVIVGRQLAKDIAGTSLGSVIRLGSVDWTVVGVFALEGNLFESEVWSGIGSVQSAFGRTNQFQSVRLRLKDDDALSDLVRYNALDPRLGLRVETEQRYYASQAAGSVNLTQYLGWPVALMLSIGAIAGTFNAMLVSIDSRKRELLILRQLGFDRSAIFTSIVFEAIALSAVGSVVGTLLAFGLFNGLLTSTLGSGFTTVTYALAVTPPSAAKAFLLATGIGVVGGLFPAWRGIAATRISRASHAPRRLPGRRPGARAAPTRDSRAT